MEMEAMEKKAADYFASMSYLANKMIQYNESVREMYHDKWDSLSWEKQEELIDQHIIDPKIEAKYSSWKRSEELPNCFPVLKINAGEKVIVDFEHDDGWTWTDEHSAPFSWKTKSQQDLTLAEIEDLGTAKDEQNKKGRVGKKARSPDRAMFESSVVNGDRSKNEVEKMFEKFGIKVPGCSDDETDGRFEHATAEVIGKDPDSTMSPSHLYNEHSKLLDDFSDTHDSRDFLFASSESFSAGKDVEVSVVRSSVSKQTTPTEKVKAPKKKAQSGGKKEKGKSNEDKDKSSKEKVNKKKKAPVSVAKQSQQSSADVANDSFLTEKREESVLSFKEPAVLESVSQIRFQEIGESSTDDFTGDATLNYGINTNDVFNFGAPDDEVIKTNNVFNFVAPDDQVIKTNDVFNFGAPDDQVIKTNDVFNFGAPDDEVDVVITTQPRKAEPSLDLPVSVVTEEAEVSGGSVVKSGFDFLDNW